jgi:hypothetical protein
MVPKDRQPPSVAAIAKYIPTYFWYRRTVSEGTKGPIAYEFTKRRVTLCREGLPDGLYGWSSSGERLRAE